MANFRLIKPCPFCGSTVSITSEPLWHGSHGYHGHYDYFIRCDVCGCTIDYHGTNNDIYRDKDAVVEEVIRLWNRRTK